jgi:uncharacterized membrane protein YgaE (UPF0421/DUF939 family)
MRSFKDITRGNTLEFYEYILKCLVGVTFGFILLKSFPEHRGQLSWMLISILLSITHDNNSKAAYDRMRGNIAGSLVGLLVYFIHIPPNLPTVCIGVAATIALCFYLDLIPVCRTALVAYIIVMIFAETYSSWVGAIYRVVSVVLGCITGLVINQSFRKITMPLMHKIEHKEFHDDAGE